VEKCRCQSQHDQYSPNELINLNILVIGDCGEGEHKNEVEIVVIWLPQIRAGI
jgi:hypothetical protein